MKRLICLLLGFVAFFASAANTGHPRLWLTSADVPRLRSWAVPSNPLFAQGLKPLVEEAKAAMDRGDVPAKDCGSTEYESYPTEMYAELFAFMSLVDNDAAARADYAGRARSLLMHIIGLAALGPASAADAWCPANQATGWPAFRSPKFFTEDSNRARYHGEAFALVVDWIYPSLSAADKAAIRGVFLRWSQEIIESGYHHPEPVGAVNNPAMLADVAQVRWAGNNYFTGHMRNLGLMALAFDAADDSNNQLRNYLANATGAWLPLFDRLTRTDAKGGFLPEGFEYSPQTASYAIQFLLALRTAGADDCGSHCQVAGNPFWDDFLNGYYHSLSPAKRSDENGLPAHEPAWYGDAQTYAAIDPINVFGALGVYDTLAGNAPRLQSLRWAQTHTPAGGADELLRRVSNTDEFRQALLYFMLLDPAAAPASDPRSQLAGDHFAPGLNRLLARTRWADTASWFSYSLSWSLIDHQQANAGEFGWYRKGEWLTKQRTGYADIAEGIGSSEFSNTLAIENDPPNRDASDWRTDLWRRGAQWNLVAAGDPKLLARSSQAAFSFVSGDATALYNSSSEGVTDVLHASRDVVWLKPDGVVVYDRAQTKTANRFKRWWLQSATPASISGQSASITTALGQRLQLNSLLPAGASLNAVNTNEAHIEDTVAGNEPMKVRLRIDAPGNPADVRFLQVLQAGDAGVPLATPTLIQSQDGTWQGTQVGSTVVMFAATPGSPLGSLSYAFTAPAASHIITGAAPNTAYCVSVSANRLSLSPGCSQLSDSGGVVHYADTGTNTAGSNSFAGPRSNYRVAKTSAGFSVTDPVGNSTALVEATSIQFADVRVNVLIGDVSKTIAAADLKTLIELYVAFFNRVPEADGLAYWIGRVQVGMSLAQIAEAFYQAAIAYSDLTDYSSSMGHADFVRIIYENVLGRSGPTAPTQAEVQYWASQLGSGQASRGDLLRSMLNSAHAYAGDATWGWVPQLLDNKVKVATFFAIEQGLNYNTPEQSIIKGMAIAAAVTATSTTAALNLIGSTDIGFNLVGALSAPWALNRATEAGLSAYLREALGPSSTRYTGNVWTTDFPLVIAAPTPASGATAVFSGTTLAETGVDEADLIKSDGSHVFSLDPDSADSQVRSLLRRQQLNPAAPDAALLPSDSLKVAFSADVRGSGLYLDADRQQMAVIAEGVTGWDTYAAWFSPQSWSQGVTEVALVDTASATPMKQRRSLRMTGQLIGSRRIGATLYLVLRSYPQITGLDASWPTDKTAANQALLNSITAAQLLPMLAIDDGKPQPLVSADTCYTQANNATPSADIITLVGIDLAATAHQHAAVCFTGGTEAFYMSDQSLYLASTRSAYSYSGAFPVYAAQSSTDIHKFALNGLNLAYRGSGNVTGHLGFDQNRKSFRMGEHKDALRVITQTSSTWRGWIGLPAPVPVAVAVSAAAVDPAVAAIESPGHLSVLQENAGALALVGELPNAARPQPLGKPGEQLYASRFIGSRGYVVTYRLTDPLYVLDLSNPADPKVAGELQVSGYSDYLFPLSETLLLGVGKEAATDGLAGDGRFAWYQGVKLSLIDVSDPAQPREAARSLIGRRGTDATVLHDHHGIALQTLGNRVRVSLPVSLHDTVPVNGTGAVNDYFGFTRTELQKFEIDPAAPALNAQKPLASSLLGQRDIANDRSLLWNDQVHYYQNGHWQSAPW